MTLKGDALEGHFGSLGEYVRQNDGQRVYWEKEEHNKVIWFAAGSWRIAKKNRLSSGSLLSYLRSTSGPRCPEAAGTEWEYAGDDGWHNTEVGDVLVIGGSKWVGGQEKIRQCNSSKYAKTVFH